MHFDSWGITKFKYDARGRVTRVNPSDGNEAADTHRCNNFDPALFSLLH